MDHSDMYLTGTEPWLTIFIFQLDSIERIGVLEHTEKLSLPRLKKICDKLALKETIFPIIICKHLRVYFVLSMEAKDS